MHGKYSSSTSRYVGSYARTKRRKKNRGLPQHSMKGLLEGHIGAQLTTGQREGGGSHAEKRGGLFFC